VAYIEKRLRGDKVTYRARYRDPSGRERNKTFNRKVDAERFVVEVEHAKSRGAWVDPTLGRVTFATWLEQWWATTTNLRESTQARDEASLRVHAAPRFGRMPLAAIRQIEVRAWVADLAAQDLKPATVVKAYQLFGKVMAAAVDAGIIAQSPCRRIPLPRIEQDEKRFLTPAEIARLASIIEPRFRALVLVSAYGGLRIGELAGLRRGRVDTTRGIVTVLEIATDVSGRLVSGPPKTRAARRTVGLPAPVAEELERHLATYAQPDPDGLVFTGPKGAALRATNFRRRIWGPAVRAAEFDGLRIHDLRHTAVALWIAAGASPKEVARRAGHTSVKTVLDVYGHLYDEADVALRERLEAMFVPVVALPTDSCGPGEHTAPSEAPSPPEEIRPDLGEPRVGLTGLEPVTSSL
jgi:integrase